MVSGDLHAAARAARPGDLWDALADLHRAAGWAEREAALWADEVCQVAEARIGPGARARDFEASPALYADPAWSAALGLYDRLEKLAAAVAADHEAIRSAALMTDHGPPLTPGARTDGPSVVLSASGEVSQAVSGAIGADVSAGPSHENGGPNVPPHPRTGA